MPDTQTERVGSVTLNPTFNYHRDVEIVKRFTERLSALSDDQHLGSEAISYVRANIGHVRDAVSGLMADDVERQIQITKDFPLRPQLFLHPFTSSPMSSDPDRCDEDDCYGRREILSHTL